MGLAMTTGIASALMIDGSEKHDADVANLIDASIAPGTLISGGSGGLEVHYTPGNTVVLKDSTSHSVEAITPVPGYETSPAWTITGITLGDTTAPDVVYLERALLKYSIFYYDPASAAPDTEIVTQSGLTIKAPGKFYSNADGKFKKDGYILRGWDTDKAGKTVVYQFDAAVPANILTAMPEESNRVLPLYAVWGLPEYQIVFDKNAPAMAEVTGTMANQLFTVGQEQALTANAYTCSGYTFEGWNTKADGSGTAYADKAAVKDLATADGASVTLYAQWEKKAAASDKDKDNNKDKEPNDKEVKKDHSPDTGDDMALSALLILLIAACGVGTATVRR